MKAISIRQPFASEISDGTKNIEFRSWSTPHRGELLICASRAAAGAWADVDGHGVVPLPVGCMICVVDLIDVRPMTQEDALKYDVKFDKSVYAWVFDPDTGDTVKPVEVLGKLKLFDVDDSLIESIPDGESVFDRPYPGVDKKIPKWVKDIAG